MISGLRLGKLAVLVALAIGLSAAAFMDAVSGVAAASRPQIAMQFVPQVEALNSAAEQRLQEGGIGAAAELVPLVNASLDRQLINPTAMKLLGIVRAASGDDVGAARAILTAQRLSRRELGTQLWLIEAAVARDDLQGALRHYDIALRASSGSAALLFPILTEALADPQIRAALAPYVRAQVPWVAQFLFHAMSELRFRDAALTVLAAGRVPAGNDYDTVTRTLIPSLSDVGEYALARRYYLATPRADAGILRSPAFTDRAIDPRNAPLTWQVSPTSGIFAEFGANGGVNYLTTAADNNVAGWGARKLIYLAADRYRLAVSYRLTEPSTGADATISLTCAAKDAPRSILDLPLAAAARTMSRDFVVPPGCPAQMVQINLRGGDVSPTELVVDNISIGRSALAGTRTAP